MKFYIETYGCTMNQGEGESMAVALQTLGLSRSREAGSADLLILNSCVVIQTTEKRMLQRLASFRESGKPTVLTGCLADVLPEKVKKTHPGAHIIPTGKKDQIPRLLKFARELFPEPGSLSHAPSSLEKKTKLSFILPISEGCLGSCSYCITRFARGKLLSYESEELVRQMRKALDAGAKEILLTSQDTAVYGRDRGQTLPSLLRELLALEGDYRIRVGMMNPASLAPILDPLLSVFKDKRLYRFLHLPVQSGSNRVLELMKRGYTVSEFRELVAKVRETMELTLSTDIIVGFPGETKEDFFASLELLRELLPDIVNITRFSERPGTTATTLPNKVHGRVSKEWSRELTTLVEELKLAQNNKFLGKKERVLITGKGQDGSSQGRTSGYRPVVVKKRLEIGSFQMLELVEAHTHFLVGKPQ